MKVFYLTCMFFIYIDSFCQKPPTLSYTTPSTVTRLKSAGGETLNQGIKIINYNRDNFIVAGNFIDSISWGSHSLNSTGQYAVFIGRFTIGGECTWLEKFTESASGSSIGVADITTDKEGNIYLAMSSVNGFNIDGRIIPHTPGSTHESVLVKLTSSGNIQWINSFSSNMLATSIQLAVNSKNNIICTGTYRSNVIVQPRKGLPRSLTGIGERNIFICSFTSVGGLQWLSSSGGDFEDNPQLAIDKSDTIFIAAQFKRQTKFGTFSLSGNGMGIVKLDPAGIPKWLIGTSDGFPYPKDMAVDNNGNIFVTGQFTNTIEFGGKSVMARGEQEIFITKILPSGIVSQIVRAGGPLMDYAGGIAIDKYDILLLTGNYNGTAYFSNSSIGYTSVGEAREHFTAAFSTVDLSHFWTEHSMDEGQENTQNVSIIKGPIGREIIVGTTGSYSGDMYFDGHRIHNSSTNIKAFLLIKRYPTGLVTPAVSSPY